MTKKIYLSGKHSDLFVLVDDEDYEWLSQYKWYLDSKWGYAKNIKDMLKLGKSTLMHRVIMNIKDPNILLDHIDRQTRNNQKTNLRICNAKENAKNASPIKNSTSKYRGVKWDKEKKLWRVTLVSNHIQIHGGYFIDEIMAALNHDQLAREHHKDFAYLNFPEIDNYQQVNIYLESTKKKQDSKYIGVCKNPNSKQKPWKATIGITENINGKNTGKTINIGNFVTEEDAARAYDKVLFENRHTRTQKPQYNFPELINE